MNSNTIKLATYGPNKGKDITIGTHTFEKGLCEVPIDSSAKALRILGRYHDVCYAHELELKTPKNQTKTIIRLQKTQTQQKEKEIQKIRNNQNKLIIRKPTLKKKIIIIKHKKTNNS